MPNRIAQEVGWQGRIIKVPRGRMSEPLITGINAAQDMITDSTLIRRELDYSEAIPLDEALHRTITWERANPPASIDPQAFDYITEDRILSELN